MKKYIQWNPGFNIPVTRVQEFVIVAGILTEIIQNADYKKMVLAIIHNRRFK